MNQTNPRVVRSKKISAVKAAQKLPTSTLLKKKVECDAQALKIVERLVEPDVDVEWMLNNLGRLNREHMEDVAEERAIVKLCGYVLCDNPLTKIVNKKYQISTIRNKVYDIEKVKNYCGFSCYSAMDHLMAQMLTSPLWIRTEEELPVFTILPKRKARTKSPPGVEVKLVEVDLPSTDDVEDTSKEKTPVQNIVDTPPTHDNTTEIEVKSEKNKIISNLSLNNHTDKDEDEGMTDWKPMEYTQIHGKRSIVSPTEMAESKLPKLDNLSSDFAQLQLDPQTSRDKPPELKTRRKVKKVSFDKTQKKTTPVPIETLTMRVEKSFTEWITPETINLLHGDHTDKIKIIENATRDDKYAALCRKFNHIQIEEQKEERSVIEPESLKPLPHFSALQEEAKNLEVKVQAFYEGKTSVGPTPVQNVDKNDSDKEAILPLTDVHNARTLRRRLFLDKLNKILPDLLRTLSGPSAVQYEYSTVKILVSTFGLSPTNICFKTAEWTLVALLIIKLLGIIDPTIKALLTTTLATKYMSMILMTYELELNYLDCLIHSVTSPPINIECDSNLEDNL